jgi:hypothetical protein
MEVSFIQRKTETCFTAKFLSRVADDISVFNAKQKKSLLFKYAVRTKLDNNQKVTV